MTRSRSRSWMLTLAGFLLVGFFSTNLLAQVSASDNVSVPESSADQTARDQFKIKLSGATMEQFVEYLRQQPYYDVVLVDGKQVKKNKELNIIITDRAKNFIIPDIDITTNVDGALSCLTYLGDEQTEITVDEIGEGGVFKIDVYSERESMVAVINARQLLGAVSEADLLSAIEIGFKMHGNSSSVQLKLHEETGLLFVRGSFDETRLVDQIVSELMAGYGIKKSGYRSGSRGGGAGAGVGGSGAEGDDGRGIGRGGGGGFGGGDVDEGDGRLLPNTKNPLK